MNFTPGTIQHCSSKGIQIQAWGSLCQGLYSGRKIDEQCEAVKNTAALVSKLAAEYQVSREAILLGFLMKHPAQIQPVIGTTNLDRIRQCQQAMQFQLSREHWYALYESARGQELP